MNKYHGVLGFVCERKKYERQTKFKCRAITEERNHIRRCIEKDVKIPDGFNQLVYGCDLLVPSLYGHISDWERISKEGYNGIYKKVTVRFELE